MGMILASFNLLWYRFMLHYMNKEKPVNANIIFLLKQNNCGRKIGNRKQIYEQPPTYNPNPNII